MEIRSRDPLHAIAVIRINLCKSPAVKIDGAPFPEWHQPMEGENVYLGDGHIKAKRADLQLCSTTPTGAPCPPLTWSPPSVSSVFIHLWLWSLSRTTASTLSWGQVDELFCCYIDFVWFYFSFSRRRHCLWGPLWLLQALRTSSTARLHLLVVFPGAPRNEPPGQTAAALTILKTLWFIGCPDNCRRHC